MFTLTKSIGISLWMTIRYKEGSMEEAAVVVSLDHGEVSKVNQDIADSKEDHQEKISRDTQNTRTQDSIIKNTKEDNVGDVQEISTVDAVIKDVEEIVEEGLEKL